MNVTPLDAGKSIRRLAELATGHGLRTVPPHHARLSRTLCDARLRNWLAQQHGVTDWRAQGSLAHTEASTAWIDLSCALGAARVGFDAARYPALASAATHGTRDADATLSATLRHAVAAILLAPALDALRAFCDDDIRIAVPRDAPPAQGHRQATPDALAIRFAHDGRDHECLVADAAPHWLALVDERLADLHVPLSRALSEIPVPGCARLGTPVLAVHTLESLRPGDVLLRVLDPALSGWFAPPARPLELHVLWGLGGARQLGVRATLDGTRLVLDSDPLMTQDTFRPDTLPSTDDAASIDSLQLPVSIEIETVTLPLVQLSALRAGYVLELPVTVRDARVRLMSYGQMIGSGELVSVGDQLGVRIIQMSGTHDSVQ
ncbi:type III secretion system cytoplasmic ring protein SctQ [Trinickia dinghuensis]|nr:type III secretion system cytoplasmic ring protein SctQ [Trinickia dinghuensis]